MTNTVSHPWYLRLVLALTARGFFGADEKDGGHDRDDGREAIKEEERGRKIERKDEEMGFLKRAGSRRERSAKRQTEARGRKTKERSSRPHVTTPAKTHLRHLLKIAPASSFPPAFFSPVRFLARLSTIATYLRTFLETPPLSVFSSRINDAILAGLSSHQFLNRQFLSPFDEDIILGRFLDDGDRRDSVLTILRELDFTKTKCRGQMASAVIRNSVVNLRLLFPINLAGY